MSLQRKSPSDRPPSRWPALAARMKATPGTWVLLDRERSTDVAKAVAHNIKRARYSGLAGGRWHAIYEGPVVLGMYLGPAPTPADDPEREVQP